MTLPREEVIAGLRDELERFERLVRSLDESEWTKATRCAGWTAGDIAAHVTGQLADIVNGRMEGLGTPEVTQREVDERRGRSTNEIAGELAAMRAAGDQIMAAIDDAAWQGPGPAGLATLGEGVEALWYDAWLHGDDIRAAIGRPSESGPGLRASAHHLADLLTQKGWGPATVVLDGVGEIPVSGGGRRVDAEPHAFVLAASGRADASTIGCDPEVNVYAGT